MSKGRILKMALEDIARGVKKVDLEDIARGVKKVDLGDLTRKPNVAARVQAVKRIAGDASKKVANTVDDWSWKGGKPGEITGGDWTDQFTENLRGDGNVKKEAKLFNRAYKQLKPLGEYLFEDEVENIMAVFASMEKANIPRRYTGKIYKATGDFIRNNNAHDWIRHPKFIRGKTNDNIAEILSKQLQPLNDKQRLEAIKLLPEWSRSLDDLGKTVEEITKMTSDQKETFLSMLPEWTESLDSLYNVAKNI